MTKTWEAVREETCRLYGEGRSLEYIRKHLLRERHFEASTRAFRLKLKAWKAKRSDSACSTCGSIPHDERTRCDSGVYLPSPRGITASSTELADQAEDAGVVQPATVKNSFGRTYKELLQAQRLGDQATQGLLVRTCDFSDGGTSVLHYAVKEPHCEGRHAVVLKLLAHMMRSGHSADIKDELRQTPLEIAIKTDQAIIVGILLEHGAAPGQPNAQQLQPVHIALQTGASAAIHGHLLRHGADPGATMLRQQQAVKPLSYAIDRLAQESAQAPKTIDGSCLKWFEIISMLVQYGAKLETTDLKNAIRLFNRYWHLSQGCDELLDCVRPILRAYFRSGLDPTLPVSASEKDSLAHSAFHHAQNNSLATLVIEEADLHKHGSALVKYILTTFECPDCPYPTPNLNEALRMLLEEMSRLRLLLDFDPLIECLTRCRGGNEIDFVTTIQELNPGHERGHTFERRDEFVTAIAALPRSTRFDISEILLRRESPIERYDGMAEIMRSVETSLTTSFASSPEMIEAPVCGFLGFCDCSKSTKQNFVHCIIHVATKDAIQQLDGRTAKEQLGRLIALREWYQLPDIDIPQRLLAQALGSKIDSTRTYVPGGVHEKGAELNDGIKGWRHVGLVD